MKKTTETVVLEAFADLEIGMTIVRGHMESFLRVDADRKAALDNAMNVLHRNAAAIWEDPIRALEKVRHKLFSNPAVDVFTKVAEQPQEFSDLKRKGIFLPYRAARAAACKPLQTYTSGTLNEAFYMKSILENMPKAVNVMKEHHHQLELALTEAYGPKAFKNALLAANKREIER